MIAGGGFKISGQVVFDRCGRRRKGLTVGVMNCYPERKICGAVGNARVSRR